LEKSGSDEYAKAVDRGKAMDRAFLMSKLFRKEYFDDIVAAINSNDKEVGMKSFSIACKRADLTDKQIVWLWNYLENYKGSKLAWNSPTGPINGW
jgi:hypothetical protein